MTILDELKAANNAVLINARIYCRSKMLANFFILDSAVKKVEQLEYKLPSREWTS